MNATAADALRAHYSDLNTETLLDLWSNEARTDWAEEVLRAELENRGVSRSELDAVSARRDEIGKNMPPAARDTLAFFGFAGRILAIGGAVFAFVIVNAIFGMKAGMFAAAAVFAGYFCVLVRRVSYQMKFRVSGWTSFVMVWMCIEVFLILLGVTFAAFEF